MTVKAGLRFLAGIAADDVVVARRLPVGLSAAASRFTVTVGTALDAESGDSFLFRAFRGTRAVSADDVDTLVAPVAAADAAELSPLLILVMRAGTGPGGRITTDAEGPC